MADEEQESGPSLEPPKLFGRKKKKPAPVEAPVERIDDTPTTVFEADDATQVTPEPVRETVPRAPVESKPPLFADETSAAKIPAPAPAPAPATEPQAPQPVKAAKAVKTPKPAKPPRADRPPLVTGQSAAALTGLIVGVAIVALTAAALQGCEQIRGTATCGSAGLPLLVAILIVMTVVGSAMLRMFHVPDPGSTSLLAVGLVAVVALLFLLGVIYNWWMIIVIPVVAIAAYLLSHWVTTAFIEPAKR